MINIKEGQFSKNLGNTKIKTRWNRGRRGLSHHSSEIILRDNQFLGNPQLSRQEGKDQGNHLFNVGIVWEIICIEIFLTEVKK
jgi:hypothetical protein